VVLDALPREGFERRESAISSNTLTAPPHS